MSDTTPEEVAQLVLDLEGLRISLSRSARTAGGTATSVHIQASGAGPRAPAASPAAAASSAPRREAARPRREEDPPCGPPAVPVGVQLLSKQLRSHDGVFAPAERIERAWRAGCRAGAAWRDGGAAPPPPPTLRLKHAVWVVLRGLRPDRPGLFQDEQAFLRAVSVPGVDAVCGGFPSQAEALAFCRGAGLSDLPDLVQ